jgi:hypothetical protein
MIGIESSKAQATGEATVTSNCEKANVVCFKWLISVSFFQITLVNYSLLLQFCFITIFVVVC